MLQVQRRRRPCAAVKMLRTSAIMALTMVIGARGDAEVDWLIATPRTTSTVTETASTLTLSNGLTSRVFALTPVCVERPYVSQLRCM